MAGLTLDESARALGHMVWLEEQSFELLGRWVPTTTDLEARDLEAGDPEAGILLARLSRRHGEHARWLAELLPDTRAHEPQGSLRPGVDGASAAWEAAAAIPPGPARLRTAIRLLEGAVADGERIVAATSPVGDAPLQRRLSCVLMEGREDLDGLRALAG